jgi:DHA1 family tetracycline resistance protein-like MFS transporter
MPPLVAAALVVLLEALAFTATWPVIGVYNEQLGGGAALTGLMLALVSFPKIFTNPLFGAISDRVGRRTVLAINTFGTLAGSAIWALSGSVTVLALSRLVTGIFSAQAGIAQAVAADVSPPAKRAAAMGLLGAAFGMAFSVGPLLGGIVGKHLSCAAVGWLCAGFQTCSLLIIGLFLPETWRRPAARTTLLADGGVAYAAAESARAEAAYVSPASESRLLRRPNVAVLLGVIVLATLGISELISTFSLFTRDRFGFSVRDTGLAFGLIGVLAIALQAGAIRGLVTRFGESRLTLAALAVLATGLGVLAGAEITPLFWLGTGLVGVGSAISMPCLASMLSRTVGADEQGAVNGLSQSANGLGRAAGNYFGGWLYQHVAAPAPYASAAALSVAALLLLCLVRPSAQALRTAASSSLPTDSM